MFWKKLCVRAFKFQRSCTEQNRVRRVKAKVGYIIHEDEMLKVKVLKAAAPSNGTNRLILRESNTHSQT